VGIVRHNLSRPLVLRDFPRDADPLSPELSLGRPELAAVLAPDQHREDLIRVGLVEVEESGLALGGRRVPRIRDGAADRCRLAEVIFRLACRQLLLRCNRAAERNNQSEYWQQKLRSSGHKASLKHASGKRYLRYLLSF
jgi:hypothetical protein